MRNNWRDHFEEQTKKFDEKRSKLIEEIEEDEDNEISASDDSSESEEESAAPSQELLHGARLHFVSEAGTVFSVAKAVLLHPDVAVQPSCTTLFQAICKCSLQSGIPFLH